MKNEITYEYRVFTNRLIDVESMEVGICTSKVIKEIKPKDKVNGRFFHTSDTDEWFFCWNNELQKLNLKGNSDVNAALAEVEKLIANANAAVEDANKTATEAKNAAAEAKTAADAASAAVESIEEVSSIANEAKSVAETAKTTAEEAKADIATAKTDAATAKTDAEAAKAQVEGVVATANQAKTDAEAAKATAEGVAETANQAKADAEAAKAQVEEKQNKIDDLEIIRTNAKNGDSAYQSLGDYYTKEEVDEMIEAINDLIGQATDKTNTILNA